MGVGGTEGNDRNACMYMQKHTCSLHWASSIVNTEQEPDLQGGPGNLLCPKMELRVTIYGKIQGPRKTALFATLVQLS